MTPAIRLAEKQKQDKGDEWLIAWILLLFLLNANAGSILTLAQRQRAQTLLRSKYEQDVLHLAAAVAAGSIAVTVWQEQLTGALATYVRTMAIAGAGTLPVQAVQAAMEQRIAEQQPFLERFAAAIGGGKTTPNVTTPTTSEGNAAMAATVESSATPATTAESSMTPAAINARSRMYGGVGWSAYFVAQGLSAGDGIVEQWVTADDGGVCGVCAPRNGQYFLPGEPPFPATDCLGGGHCRCERLPVYAPDIYARLSRQGVKS